MTNQYKQLNVLELKDIVESQLCVHGDHKIFILPDTQHSIFLTVNNQNVMDCLNENDSCINENSLQHLLNELQHLDDDAPIGLSNSEDISADFAIGFKSDEGFVETINASEIYIDTILR
ncbi:hypothetical protein [Psychromonas sp. SP041]|uniref:hypothetical protein n=1 Tax=Psychromonas sp. SP041 TaxID=1365007 RepID=UPI00046FECB8|nr:hypothetical protein [Psychromonas sp. SP041]